MAPQFFSLRMNKISFEKLLFLIFIIPSIQQMTNWFVDSKWIYCYYVDIFQNDNNVVSFILISLCIDQVIKLEFFWGSLRLECLYPKFFRCEFERTLSSVVNASKIWSKCHWIARNLSGWKNHNFPHCEQLMAMLEFLHGKYLIAKISIAMLSIKIVKQMHQLFFEVKDLKVWHALFLVQACFYLQKCGTSKELCVPSWLAKLYIYFR